MKKKFLLLPKIIGWMIFYSLILVSSILLTMNYLIKGKEVKAPNFFGKSLNEAYAMAKEHGIYLKKISGRFDKRYKPLTVIDQFPGPGVRVKEKSFVKIFITSEVLEIRVPDLAGYSLRECEKILKDNDLRKGYVSYMNAEDVPLDFIIDQSFPAGSKVPQSTEVDLLVSQGRRETSYMMPDLIGMRSEDVVYLFESQGLRITNINKTSYPRLEPDIVTNQIPAPGFRINARARITIEVNE